MYKTDTVRPTLQNHFHLLLALHYSEHCTLDIAQDTSGKAYLSSTDGIRMEVLNPAAMDDVSTQPNLFIYQAELLKVADVQTHVCAKYLSLCAKFVFLNAKQEKQALFYDFGTI